MISVIIPTYKRSKNLTKAIDSVLIEEGDFEVIVVDDNDPDSEYRKENEILLKKYSKNKKFKYIKHEKNKNGAAARNTGIRIAKGEYITFLDDDDLFCNGRIAAIEKILIKEKPDFICTGILIKKNGIAEKTIIPNVNKSNRELQIELLNQKSFFGSGSNIICKKEIVDKINGFDESFIRNQDIEFVIRVLDHAKNVRCIPEILVVKNVDDYMNVPLFKTMVKVKEKLLSKFSYILDEISKEERKKIIVNNYYELLGVAYLKKDKSNLRECKNYLKSIGLYSLKKDMKLYGKYIIKNFYLTKKIRSLIKI